MRRGVSRHGPRLPRAMAVAREAARPLRGVQRRQQGGPDRSGGPRVRADRRRLPQRASPTVRPSLPSHRPLELRPFHRGRGHPAGPRPHRRSGERPAAGVPRRVRPGVHGRQSGLRARAQVAPRGQAAGGGAGPHVAPRPRPFGALVRAGGDGRPRRPRARRGDARQGLHRRRADTAGRRLGDAGSGRPRPGRDGSGGAHVAAADQSGPHRDEALPGDDHALSGASAGPADDLLRAAFHRRHHGAHRVERPGSRACCRASWWAAPWGCSRWCSTPPRCSPTTRV